MRKTLKHYMCTNCLALVDSKDDICYCNECGKKLTKRDLKPTAAQFKRKKLWPLFSRYIRVRDCLRTTDNMNKGICYTCGKEFPFEKLQAGHMVPGRKDNVLFEEEIVKAQCYSCNVSNHGDHGRFVLNKMQELMKEGYSLEESYHFILNSFNKKEIHYTLEELIKIYKKYEFKLKELENDRSAVEK